MLKDFILTMWKVLWLVFGCFLCGFRYSSGKQLGDIDLGCPQGSYRHGNFCYEVWPVSLIFQDANSICNVGNGFLAASSDSETEEFLQKLYMRQFSQNYWIGLDDKKVEGRWVFSDNTTISDFNKWVHGQPDNLGGDQHCALMWMRRNLLWNDIQCSLKMLYICEYDAFTCGNRFPSYGSSCYELSKDFANYDEANMICQKNGGILVTIKDEGTFNFLKKKIYAERFWLNMNDTEMQSVPRMDRDEGAWIGIQFLRNNWVYMDETPVTFTNWARGNPSSDKSRVCTKLRRYNWYNEQCDVRLPFICQYPGNAHCESPPTNLCCPFNLKIKSSFSMALFHDDKKIHEIHSST